MSISESVRPSFTRIHNPCGEVRRASRMRENLTYGSDGEGLETDRCCWPAPRQSLTRQLLFRELKSQYRLTQIPSRNIHVSEALIYSALLCLAVSRRLHRAVIEALRLNADRCNFDRWSILFASVAQDLFDLLVFPKYYRKYREND